MATNQEVADRFDAAATQLDGTAQAFEALRQEYQGKPQEWDGLFTGPGGFNERIANFLANRKIGFGLQDTLMDHRDAPVTLQPRFGTLAEAEAFQFSAPEDYSPEGSCLDLQRRVPNQAKWYSEPYPTQFTGKQSVYADISVGFNPHPAEKPVSRIAVLIPYSGAHNPWLLSGAEHDYSKPRYLGSPENAEWANGEIKGQSWGVTSYDDLIALLENQQSGLSIGSNMTRIINLGPHPIHVKGYWVINHGMMKEAE